MTANITPSKTLEVPAHPLLSDWAINRKLENLGKNYRRDQEEKSAEIQSSSSMGNPRVAFIFYKVKRLRQYVEEFEGVYQAEIESGRVADSPDLWAGVWQKVLIFVSAQTVSLFSNPGQRMWLSTGESPGVRASVQAAFEETQRDLSRLRTELDVKLENAKQARAAEKAQPTLETTVDAQNGDEARQSQSQRQVDLGGWAEQRLEEMRKFANMLRGGKSPESLRPQFPGLFSEVIDRLTTPRQNSLFREAQGRMLRVDELMDWIADVKNLKGSTLGDYRKAYRRETCKTRETLLTTP
jgi:hypothetical protein